MLSLTELMTAILLCIAACIGVPTAIIQLKKARSKNVDSRGRPMSIEQKSNLGVVENVDQGNIVHQSNTSGININDSQIGGSIIFDNPNSFHTNSSVTDDSIILQNVYASLFAEDGEIHSERIKISHVGNGRVEGTVFLDDTNTYSLTGTFKNRILTGEFTSIGQYIDERGTINLKLVSENLLSGFCSFSKISMTAADQIRMSPYVWVAGQDVNLVNGTYEFCTQCHNDGRTCCCSSPDVDMPVLLYSEAQKLQSRNPRHQKMRDFSRSIGNTPIRQMNSAKDASRGIHCHFYDCSSRKCKVYDIRPTDCRLFPFDIKLDTNTNEYWVGYYSDLCNRELPSIEIMKQYAHILRPQLFILFPYANTINQEDVCKHLLNANFEKLYKLDKLIF